MAAAPLLLTLGQHGLHEMGQQRGPATTVIVASRLRFGSESLPAAMLDLDGRRRPAAEFRSLATARLGVLGRPAESHRGVAPDALEVRTDGRGRIGPPSRLSRGTRPESGSAMPLSPVVELEDEIGQLGRGERFEAGVMEVWVGFASGTDSSEHVRSAAGHPSRVPDIRAG
jgi:hypothetical protein